MGAENASCDVTDVAIARPDGTFEERWCSPVNSAVLDDDRKVEARARIAGRDGIGFGL